MLNNQGNPFYQQRPTQGGTALARTFGMDVHMKASWATYGAAIEEGQRKFEASRALMGKTPGYMVIDVGKARQAGILPLPL